MSEILRHTSHGNNISVISLKSLGIIRKIAFSNYSKFYILKEKNGLYWYQNLINEELIFIKEFVNLKDYAKLDINFLDGFTINYIAPLRKTYFYINQCVDHYVKYWPKRQFVPIHGDLTLSNVIFNNKDPICIDWEHFSDEQFDWGFDIAYLLLSSIILPDRNKQDLNPKDILIFSKLWKKIANLGLNKVIIERPISYFKKIFTTNKNWEKIICDSPYKLFPLSKSNEYCAYFENIIIKNTLNKY